MLASAFLRMDVVFSTRMDEEVLETLDRLAATQRKSRKQIVETAILLYGKAVEQRPDAFDVAFGAWRRAESPEALHRRIRAAFEDSMRRRWR